MPVPPDTDLRQTKGSSDQISSARSAGMSLARRFNAVDQMVRGVLVA